MRTFVLKPAEFEEVGTAADLFWNIDLQQNDYVITWGKAGEAGQTKTKSFVGKRQGRRAVNRLVAKRLMEGYVETTPGTLAMLERALQAEPDDPVAHMAYADLLMERGDPRGELIRVQMQLEKPGMTQEELAQLRKRERQLLMIHSEDWLGDTARFFEGDWCGPHMPYSYEFARGWIDQVRVLPAPEAALSSIGVSPEFRLLRRLEVVHDMNYHGRMQKLMERLTKRLTAGEKERSEEVPMIMERLLDSPYLGNLRVFKLGFSDDRYSSQTRSFERCRARHLIELLQRCPRLQELYLNTHVDQIHDLFAAPELGQLRVLQYFNGFDLRTGDPFAVLARNAEVKNLTTLRLRPAGSPDIERVGVLLRSPYLTSLTHLQLSNIEQGDTLCQTVVDCGMLARLKSLDLAHCEITSQGVLRLNRCPDLAKLKFLCLSGNNLRDNSIEINAIKKAGVQVIIQQRGFDDFDADAEPQNADDEYDDDDYDGDME